MEPYISLRYRDLLTRHGLDTFAGFWDLPRNWVEEPNVRRNGWSGASRYTLVDGDGCSLSMVVKLQENHKYRSLRYPLKGRPTFYRDFVNIRRLEQIGVPTAEPVFYGERRKGDNLQALLVTAGLDGYLELNSVFGDSSLKTSHRQAILHRVADVLRLIHSHHLQHNCLSGKHVMAKLCEEGAFDIRILDLERMKRSWGAVGTAAHDLQKFIRHSPTLSAAEHAELIGHYARSMSPAQRRKLAVMINRRIASKRSARGGAFPVIQLND